MESYGELSNRFSGETSMIHLPSDCYLHTIIMYRTVIVSVIKAITVLCNCNSAQDSTWSFFHLEWRVMESCQTVFSGVLPGVESFCPCQKQA